MVDQAAALTFDGSAVDFPEPLAPTVQYEHTVVATPRGAVVVTLAG